jgi:hypothetical protein
MQRGEEERKRKRRMEIPPGTAFVLEGGGIAGEKGTPLSVSPAL